MTAFRGKIAAVSALISLHNALPCYSFTVRPRSQFGVARKPTHLNSDSWEKDQSQDSNTWSGSNDADYQDQDDWQALLAKKSDGSYWSEFEPSETNGRETTEPAPSEVDEAEAWLDTIASLSAEEVEFNRKEADRADKARQMEEWGFEKETIANTLDVAVDDSLERSEEVKGMTAYREQSYLDDFIDLTTVESHTRVEIDEETGEAIRSQMVYVDEHTWCV